MFCCKLFQVNLNTRIYLRIFRVELSRHTWYASLVAHPRMSLSTKEERMALLWVPGSDRVNR